MASIFTDLVKTFIEKVMNKTISETSYICCFTCIVEDFEKEKEKLKAKMKTMDQRIEVAKRRVEDIPIEVIHWKQQTDKLIEEDTETKMTCFFGWCPNCKWRYLKGKKLEDMTQDIRSLMGFHIDSFGLASRLPGVGYHSSQYYVSFKSRELKYKELVDALVDANTYITGLQGMGGTGKTTMAKEVGKELEGLKQFDYVTDTTVSYTPYIKKIQDDIAAPLGLKWENCTESERSKKLWSRLTNGEKILVILDDVWGDINFEEIGIPYSDNHKCCKVLLTTRDVRVCNSMGCDRTIQLDLLSDEEAWILFKKYASISDSSPKGILDKGKKISKECKGLPVAIAAIGATLKGQQSHEEWKTTLASLRNPMDLHGVGETRIEVYNCLRYSYDNTKNDKAKKLFLLCSVFQEDEEINYEILNRLAIGTGLFGEVYETYDEARTQVVVAKNKLIDSCLLITTEKDSVKMHDLVREVALWIAKKTIRTMNLSNRNQKSLLGREKKIKYMLCEGKHMDVFSCRFDGYSNLEVLIVYFDDERYNYVQVPNSFFENMTRLQVLYLSTKSGIKQRLSLPQSIMKLMCIRSLILESLDFGDISILGTLRSLETLDFIKCSIKELPLEISKLEKLKLLKLYKCHITNESNPFEVVARCSSLEEFYFEDVDYLLVVADKPEVEIIHQNTTFPALGRFRLIVNDLGVIEPMYSKCVCIPNIDCLVSEATIKYLMQRAEVLHLRDIKREWINVMPDVVPMDEGTNNLCKLYLICCQKLQHLIDTKHVDNSQLQNFCSKLVTLRIYEMNNLKELCNGPLPIDLLKSLEQLQIQRCENMQGHLFKSQINLCNLKTMTIWSCPRLESLFLLSNSRSLVMLEELNIHNCKELKSIVRDERKREETEEADYDDNSCSTMFPNLKTLNIVRCARLEFIFPFLSAGDVTLLKTIYISDCGEIKFIFGKYQRHDQKVKDDVLPSLNEVFLDRLPNFIDIFPEYSLSMKRPSVGDGSVEIIPLEPIKRNIIPWTHMCCYGHKNKNKLTSTATTNILVASRNKYQDRSISSVTLSNSQGIHLWEYAHCLSKHSQILCNIKEIGLFNLQNKKSIFIMCLTPNMVLESLTIWNCEELKQIVIDTKDDHNTSNWGDVFPKLKHLNVKDCAQLEYIFGVYPDSHNNHNDILLHLPALETINLGNLPNLIGICPKVFRTAFPALKEVNATNFSQFKSIEDMMIPLDSRQLDNRVDDKDLSGKTKHFLTLEILWIQNSKIEYTFCLNEKIGQDMKFGLREIHLFDLPHMTNLFYGGQNGSFILQNLEELKIERCERLEVVFPLSILKCLPHLQYMSIKDCQELKQIIEEDVENEEIMSNIVSPPMTCFPMLTKLEVQKCNKLKCVLHVSKSDELPKLTTVVVKKCNELKCVLHVLKSEELPNLKYLVIKEASQLEQVFKCEHSDQQVKLPNLKYILFVDLPHMWQEIESQTQEGRLVQNCPKLCPTPMSILDDMRQILDHEYEMELHLKKEFRDAIDAVPSVETTEQFQPAAEKDFVENNPHLEISSTEILPADSELITSPIPLHITQSHCEEETEDHDAQEDYMSLAKLTTISSTNLETSTVSQALLQKGINTSVGTTSEKNQEITSSTDLKSVIPLSEIFITFDPPEKDDGKKTMPSLSVATIEHPTTIDDGVKDFLKTSDFPNALTIGNHSQIEENLLSFTTSITRELEQLVFDKYLAKENLSLLIDFLVKHPRMRLVDNPRRLTSKYKGYGYGSLADVLKFLQTQSVLDVLESGRSKFVELLEEVRNFPFDKEWLDDVERRALSPNLPISREVWQKLSHSKQHATQKVEELRLKVRIFTQHTEDLKNQLASSEAELESIIQQEAQVLQARAALSVPLSY